MINRSITLEIGGQERTVKYTIAALEELETLLTSHNAIALMSGGIWSMTDTVSAAYCGLKSTDRRVTRPKAAEWVAAYVREHGLAELQMRLGAAIGLSGLLGGEVSAFEDILAGLDAPKDEEADEEGKN